MSGKPGRPPEDRLRRQHEIFLAVAPLIERYGAKRLSMRQAARSAHLSLGGLESCTRPLGHALPECTPEEIHSLGRSVRRTFFSALIDRTVTSAELRHELLSLIQGWPATVRQKTLPSG
jgi:hypothetical protein